MFFRLPRAEANIQIPISGSCGALASTSQCDSYCTTVQETAGLHMSMAASKPTKKLPSLADKTSPPAPGIPSPSQPHGSSHSFPFQSTESTSVLTAGCSHLWCTVTPGCQGIPAAHRPPFVSAQKEILILYEKTLHSSCLPSFAMPTMLL